MTMYNMTMDYHPTVNKIISLLKANNCWFETFEHQPVRTSQQAAKIRTGYNLKQGAKAMIVRVRPSFASPNRRATAGKVKIGKQFVMLVYPADKKFDSKKVKQILKTNDLRFATEEEVIKITNGVIPGGVPPFGNLFGLEVFADQSLFDNEKIVFNAGDQRFSIAMKSADYPRVVKPKIASFV